MYAPGGESDPGVQVRWLGYRGGGHVLDLVLAAVAGPRPGAPTGGETWDHKTRRLARLAVELRTTPADATNVGKWLLLDALGRECRRLGVKPK
jgi:hypothetical protein